jgi:hypothetical protein
VCVCVCVFVTAFQFTRMYVNNVKLCMCVCVCLSVCSLGYIHLYMCMFSHCLLVCLSIGPTLNLWLNARVCLSINLIICSSLYQTILSCQTVFPSFLPLIFLSVHLSATCLCLSFFCLSIRLFIHSPFYESWVVLSNKNAFKTICDSLSCIYTGKVFFAKTLTILLRDYTTLLALATLDKAIQTVSLLSVSNFPRWPRQIGAV